MPTYRIEVSPNSRAGCKNTECKHAGIKIQQGELRFGNLVEIRENQSWHYKHWGCVTPFQIENWAEVSGKDPDMIDGLDDLPKESQDKVMRALEQGHVDDEDWKGDPEMNRDGNKKFRMVTPKKPKQAKTGEEQNETANASPSKPKKRGRAKDDDEDEEDKKVPRKKAKKAAPKSKKKDTDEAPVAAKARKSKRAAKSESEADDSGTEPEPEPKKSTKKKAEPAKTKAGSAKTKAVPAAKKKAEAVSSTKKSSAVAKTKKKTSS